MRLQREGAFALVDAAAQAVARLGPYTALLWLTALPTRLFLALFIVRLDAFGEAAPSYGDYLRKLALGVLLTWLLSLWGRQVFVRACRETLETGKRATTPFRVPAADYAAHLAAALAIELCFWALLLTFVAPAFLALAAGLAAAAAPRGGPGLLKPLKAVAENAGPLMTLVKLLLFFLIALPLAALNLHALVRAALWAASAVASVEGSGWGAVLSLENPLYVTLLFTGAALLVEPFWLAALTAQVERARSARSGDDLRQWFVELKA